jgi:hypothetical protein
MPESVPRANWFFGLIGAVIGGTAGVFAYWLLLREGFLGLILPGALLGMGCGALSGGKSNGLGALCGVAGAVLGVATEWWFRPFLKDDSLRYFLMNLPDLPKPTLISLVAGAFFGFWFGRGREGGAWLRRKPKA